VDPGDGFRLSAAEVAGDTHAEIAAVGDVSREAEPIDHQAMP